MKRTISLDDLSLFLAVYDGGGLGEAVRRTGTSAPTLSRRMAALERQLGARLFERGPKGYRATAEGRALAAELADLRPLATRVQALAEDRPLPRIRIAAGPWTARFIARTLPGLLDGWLFDLLPGTERIDLARRAADIGVRNARPDQPWLAGRKTADIRYARFARDAQVEGYIATAPTGPPPPSLAWLQAEHAQEITVTAPDPRLALDLARGGLGRIVLPVFAARDSGLVQIGPEIDALTHEEWLVAHQDARHDPPLRKALDTLATLLTDRALRA